MHTISFLYYAGVINKKKDSFHPHTYFDTRRKRLEKLHAQAESVLSMFLFLRCQASDAPFAQLRSFYFKIHTIIDINDQLN